jgi:hypothetical protein
MIIAITSPQTSLDPLQTRSWIPNMAYGGHAFGFRAEGRTRAQEFQMGFDARDKILAWIREYSPYERASAGDPPIYMDYPNQKEPVVAGTDQKDPTHSAILGLKMAERLTEVGVEVHLNYPERPAALKSAREFVLDRLQPVKPRSTGQEADGGGVTTCCSTLSSRQFDRSIFPHRVNTVTAPAGRESRGCKNRVYEMIWSAIAIVQSIVLSPEPVPPGRPRPRLTGRKISLGGLQIRDPGLKSNSTTPINASANRIFPP